MMASLLLSRVLGILREMILNWQFGQNAETDAYRLAFQIPDLLFYLVAGGALSSAFIPVFSEYLHTKREEDAWKVFSAVASIMSLAIGGMILLAWVFATPLAHLVAPKAPDEIMPLIVSMSRILLPAQFAFFIGGLLMGTLYSRQVFSVPGLGPNIYNLGIIFGALVISHFVVPGVMGMTWGALFGAWIGSFLIPLVVMRRMGSSFKFSLNTSHPGVRKVFRLMVPVVLGLSLPGVFPIILQGFATFFQITGLNSALQNANQMMQAPLGVFGQSLALAAFPALAQFFAQERMDLYRDQLSKSLCTVLYLSVPVATLLVAIPAPIIQSAFEHGKFTHADTLRTAECLRMYAIGVAAWCLQPVLMRAFFAIQKTVLPIVLGTIATAVFITLCVVSVSGSFGYLSLPLAASAAGILLAVLMIGFIRREVGGLDIVPFGTALWKTLCSSLVAAAIVLPLSLLLPEKPAGMGKAGFILGVGLICLVFAWVYYAITRFLKMPESDFVRRAMTRRTAEPT